MADPRIDALADELVAARDAFMAALGDVDPALLTSPGLVGEWSARELLAHLGYWAGHAGEAIHHASQDRLDEFEVDVPSVDERNAVVARVAGETTLRTVQSREEQAFEALRERVLEIDPAVARRARRGRGHAGGDRPRRRGGPLPRAHQRHPGLVHGGSRSGG